MTSIPPMGVFTILTVEVRGGKTYAVCRRQGTESVDGVFSHSVNAPLGSVEIDKFPPDEVADTLAVWAELHRPIGISATLRGIATRRGIALPEGLATIDLSIH